MVKNTLGIKKVPLTRQGAIAKKEKYWEEKLRLKFVEIENLVSGRAPKVGLKFLRGYQEQDVQVLRYLKREHNQGAGVFNQQRTGKTPTTLTFLQYEEDINKVLIVCESGLVKKWEAEVIMWAPRFKLFKHSTTVASRLKTFKDYLEYKGAKVIIITPGIIAKGTHIIFRTVFDSAVFDEGHFLQSGTSAQTKACRKIARKSRYNYILSGTPLAAKPHLTFSLMSVIKPNGELIDTRVWSDYFCNTKPNRFSSYLGYEYTGLKESKKEEFLEWIRSNATQRTTKKVMSWVPKEIPSKKIFLSFNEEQEELTKTLIETGEIKGVPIANHLEEITRLRQIALAPKTLIKTATKAPKTLWLRAFIRKNPNLPFIVFSTFTKYLKILQKDIEEEFNTKVLMLTGQETGAQKFKAEQAFQKGEINIILCNIKAGGKGWTLDRAHTMIFMDISFRWDENDQAESRINPVHSRENQQFLSKYYLIMSNSIEAKVNSISDQKLDNTTLINQFTKWLEVKKQNFNKN